MPVVRFNPGEAVRISGTYALYGHYGEPSEVAVWREAGERLPLMTAAVEGPLWFVLVGISNETAIAA
jgi:hypothetical protein